MSADGVPRAALTCSAYQHVSKTCSKSVVPSLANIGEVVVSKPFVSAMLWSVGYANSLWIAMLAPLLKRREFQPFSLMFAQVSMLILPIIFAGHQYGVILLESNPCHMIRSRAAIRGRTLCSGSTPHRQRPSSTRTFWHSCIRDLHEVWCFVMHLSANYSQCTSTRVFLH